MNIPKAIKSVLFSLSLIYSLVSGFGMAAMGTMPMSVTPTFAMLGHENRMCLMPAADHFSAWESTFRAMPERQQALPTIILAALVVAASVLVSANLSGLQGRLREWKWPPGYVPLFIRIIGRGTHQRVTYG